MLGGKPHQKQQVDVAQISDTTRPRRKEEVIVHHDQVAPNRGSLTCSNLVTSLQVDCGTTAEILEGREHVGIAGEDGRVESIVVLVAGLFGGRTFRLR